MKVGKFLAAVVFYLIFLSGNCFARWENDPTLLADMRTNSQNYIGIGGAGTGLSIWLCKKSFDIQQYAPPKYIIAVQWADYSVQSSGTSAYLGMKRRYLYNYDERKIYVEETDEKGNTGWKYLDPKKANGPSVSLDSKDIASAEYAFYFSYNMSFFKEPVSNGLKRYIETGDLYIFHRS